MEKFLVWLAISGVLFICFLGALIWALVKKRKTLFIFSFATLILFLGSASWTIYLLADKSYNKISAALKPRTGDEIYFALFGKTEQECLKVLNYQDQVIPIMDDAILLHFVTCPDELERILQLHHFTMEKRPTLNWQSSGSVANGNWFTPETIGDTILIFTYSKDEYGNGQTIYSSTDSTKAYCVDILN